MKVYWQVFHCLCLCLIGWSHSALAEDNPLLKYVPADSVFFSGNAQVINFSDYPIAGLHQSLTNSVNQVDRKNMSQGWRFFYEFMADFDSVINEDNRAIKEHYGFAEQMSAVFYSVDTLPVIKMTLDNKQAFLKVLNDIESKSEFKHQQLTIGNLFVRAYPIHKHGQLIINIQPLAKQKLLTIALINKHTSQRQKRIILGLQLPKQSLLKTQRVTQIQKRQGYLPLSISFIDFQQLVKLLFTTKQNPLPEIISEQWLTQMQQSGCEADVQQIAKSMPIIMAGYKQYETQKNQLKMAYETLLELKDQQIKSELAQFRGFIPTYIREGSENTILAFGLGANMSQLSPMFFQLSKTIRESTFHCQQFKQMQQNVAQFNPMMLALTIGMAEGVQGVSFALQSKSQQSKQEKKVYSQPLSFIMSLSADDPRRVWQMLAALNPDFALMVPSEKPQHLFFPELEALGFKVFIAIKGQHIVIYSGHQAEQISLALQKEKVENNGFFQNTVNYNKLNEVAELVREYLISPLNQEPLSAEECVQLDETIYLISLLRGIVDFRSDFVSTGWQNEMFATLHTNPKNTLEISMPGDYETYYINDGCELVKDGLEDINDDGTGFYRQYSNDGQCFIFETQYRWKRKDDQLELQYLSEHSRPEGLCSNPFNDWAIPKAEFINDTCYLRMTPEGQFACVYEWDGELNKAIYKGI